MRYVFDGDFVDRGHYGAEVILLLSALKCYSPENVALLRGNHEDTTVCVTLLHIGLHHCMCAGILDDC